MACQLALSCGIADVAGSKVYLAYICSCFILIYLIRGTAVLKMDGGQWLLASAPWPLPSSPISQPKTLLTPPLSVSL